MANVDVRPLAQPFRGWFRTGLMKGLRGRAGACVFLVAVISATSLSAQELRVDEQRIGQHILELSQFGRNHDGGVSRVAYSDADIQGRAYAAGLMEEAGLEVSVDAAGNLIGRRSGSDPALAPIMFGSHIDTVPRGGNFDGNVGVIGAIEVVQTLHDAGVMTRHPLTVIVFANEEGGLVGSRALAGQLSDEALNTLALSGFTNREGIKRIGGDPDALGPTLIRPGEITAFLELHIEQGPVLHEEGVDIGIVEGIVGIRWWDVTIEGVANHAGTTTMNRRSDALVAGAELILAVNRTAKALSGGQVATVGRISATPGAPNVIPGLVEMSLEIRDLEEAKMKQVFAAIVRETRRIEETSGARIHFDEVPLDAKPAPTDQRMQEVIAEAAEKLGLTTRRMSSGAGHDSQEMAAFAPTGMIFVPSVDGISHAPTELTELSDMANGANTLLHSILAIDEMSW